MAQPEALDYLQLLGHVEVGGMLAGEMRVRSGAMSELGLIEQLRKGFARRSGGVRMGIGDDCAVLRMRLGWDVVVTTDLMLEGRHFRRDLHAPESVGHRCIVRGLSDIAAMGAEPVAAFLSLGLPVDALSTATQQRFISRFFHGVCTVADGSGVVLAGGDTGEVAGEEMVADIVLVGQVPRGEELRRSGARVGDGIYVTGSLGGAAAELGRMMSGRGRRGRRKDVPGAQPQSYPEARLGAGAALRRRGLATACIDVSDGLSTDLRHLCEASGVGAEVWEKALPMHPLAKGELRLALDGGEDYELLFTVPERVAGRVPGRMAGVAVTRIGEVVRKAKGVSLVGRDEVRRELVAGGWEHFRG